MSAGKRLVSLIALALNLDEDFFEKVGAMDKPRGFLRLLHYPGELGSTDEEIYGASAHSDYGMVTLLASNGVPGLQVCRDKSKQPRIWEDVLQIDGAFIVNIGDMMERWTNCLFRSTLHRVMPTGQERYSVAFFMRPNDDCVVECLKSCCSEASPPRVSNSSYYKILYVIHKKHWWSNVLVGPLYTQRFGCSMVVISLFYECMILMLSNPTHCLLLLGRLVQFLSETCCNSQCYVPQETLALTRSTCKGFPPVRSGDYLEERFRLTYGT